MRIIPLGTSAGTPTLRRNVASFAIGLERGWLLIDCGEGTQYRLLAAPVRTGRLDSVLISHLHGDHVYGLPGLLASLSLNGRSAPLPIYGPAGLGKLLHAVHGAASVHLGFTIEIHEIGDEEIRRTPGYRIEAHELEHSVPSFGFRLAEAERPGRFDPVRARDLGIPEGPLYGKLQRGESVSLPDGRVIESSAVVAASRPGKVVTYCTDTRPCAASVELAHRADLLIHEATYGDDHESEAREYLHSTASEAAAVARDAGAKRLLLTHFSPRYEDVTPLLQQARELFPATEIAEDLAELEV
ncbi:MAG: ribonuclease Z [Thermoanaerobaculia bacterium]